MGIEMLNSSGIVLLTTLRGEKNTRLKVFEIQIENDERLVGVKSGLRRKGCAFHFDVQFIIGSII